MHYSSGSQNQEALARGQQDDLKPAYLTLNISVCILNIVLENGGPSSQKS